MSKIFLSAMVIAACGMVHADNSEPKFRKAPDPAKMAAMEAHQGGRIIPPDNGNRILVWDVTGKAGESVNTFINLGKRLFHIPVTVKVGGESASDLYAMAKTVKSPKNPCVILIGDAGDKLPALSIYPEESIGCINYAALECADKEKEAKRISKELFRAFGFACGGYSITRTACAMGLVYSLDDLDSMNAVILSPMRFSGINRSAAKLGLPVLRATTYQMACRQGWAPAPTNDVQKAIWEKCKNLPKISVGDPFARPVKR